MDANVSWHTSTLHFSTPPTVNGLCALKIFSIEVLALRCLLRIGLEDIYMHRSHSGLVRPLSNVEYIQWPF